MEGVSCRNNQTTEEDTLLGKANTFSTIDGLEEESFADEGQNFTSSHHNGIGMEGYMANESKPMLIQVPENRVHSEGQSTSQMPLTEIQGFSLCLDEEEQANPGDLCFQSEMVEPLDQGTNIVNEIYWKALFGQFGKEQNQAMKYQNESNAINIERLIFWLPVVLITIVNSLVQPTLLTKKKPTKRDRDNDFLTKQNLMIGRAVKFLEQVLRKLEHGLTDSNPKGIQTSKAEFWSQLENFLKRQCNEIFSDQNFSRMRPAGSFDLMKDAKSEDSKSNSPHIELALNQMTKSAARRLKSGFSDETTKIQSLLKALPGSSKGRLSVVNLNMIMSSEFNSYLKNINRNNQEDKKIKEAILKELANIQTASNKIGSQGKSSDVPYSDSSFNFHIHCLAHLGTSERTKAQIVIKEVPCETVENAICEVIQGRIERLSEDDYTKALEGMLVAKAKKRHAKIERETRGSKFKQQNINQDSSLGKRTETMSSEEFEIGMNPQKAYGSHHHQCSPLREESAVSLGRRRSSKEGFAVDAPNKVEQGLEGVPRPEESVALHNSPLLCFNDDNKSLYQFNEDRFEEYPSDFIRWLDFSEN